jgi:tripartite-type tricarboxylate transporter receptor subunit TctC
VNTGRRLISRLIGLSAFTSLVPKVFAQSDPADTYPNKLIRLLCPFAPAGGVDITARTIAQKLTEVWGQTVIVENKAGANGTIAVDIAARAPADGYTLSMISSSHSVNVTLLKTQLYDLVNDLAPITQATAQPYVLVINPELPVKNMAELIALAKSSSRPLTYGSSGIGGFSHLAGGLLGLLSGTDLMNVPYKGGSLAMNDVISGQIDMLFSTILQAHGHIASGRLRALAVTTTERSPSLPNVPTMQEAGVKDYEITGWYGVVAPAGTPVSIINKLNKEIVSILKTPAMAERLSADGSLAVGNSPQAFGQFIRSEIAKWRKVIQELKIRG